jgi:phosphate transport system substrate-binding protein
MVVILTLPFVIGPLGAGHVRVVGSDLLGLEFFKAVHSAAAAEAIDITMALDGSRSGWAQLRDGSAELALLTLTSDETVDKALFSSVPLAWHCVFVIVPGSVPLERVNFPQLAAVFGRDVPVSFQRWGDLGLSGEWLGTPIIAVAPAVGWNLTAQIFRDRVMLGESMKATVARYTSLADLAHRLKGDTRSIVLSPVYSANSLGQKILPVGVRQKDQAFLPTPENLRSGSYPLALPLNMVFPHGAKGRIGPLVRFLLSDRVAVILEHAGLVPMSQLARLKELQLVGNVSGANPEK